MSSPYVQEAVTRLIRESKGEKAFTEHEVKAFLLSTGIPVPRGVLIPRIGEVPFHHNLSFPVAAKLSSSVIASKSDLHGVRLDIRNEEELRDAVSGLKEIRAAEGVLIEEMAPKGLEVIIGGTRDRQFGPVVMFGLGGVFVEVFRDLAFCLAPMSHGDACWLINQLKGSRLLDGYRGNPPVDRDSLVNIIITVSEIMATGLVREIDLNPVALYPVGAMVLDAKMQVL